MEISRQLGSGYESVARKGGQNYLGVGEGVLFHFTGAEPST